MRHSTIENGLKQPFAGVKSVCTAVYFVDFANLRHFASTNGLKQPFV